MTKQIKEIVKYKNEEYGVNDTPLDPYLDEIIEEPLRLSFMTSCWRGYQGYWEIKDDKLYLNRLEEHGVRFIFPRGSERQHLSAAFKIIGQRPAHSLYNEIHVFQCIGYPVFIGTNNASFDYHTVFLHCFQLLLNLYVLSGKFGGRSPDYKGYLSEPSGCFCRMGIHECHSFCNVGIIACPQYNELILVIRRIIFARKGIT